MPIRSLIRLLAAVGVLAVATADPAVAEPDVVPEECLVACGKWAFDCLKGGNPAEMCNFGYAGCMWSCTNHRPE